MPHQMTMNTLHKALLGIVFLGLTHQACLAAGKTCVQDASGITEICMEWDQQQNPVEGQDFLLDFADPANPDITLKAGNMGWGITSEKLTTGLRGNVGTVSIDPSQPTDNFGVAFLSTGFTGVASVGSIDLTAASWTGESNMTGGTIYGDVGDIEVASAPDGSGGSLSLVIQGQSGAIHAASMSNLTIGTLGGTIEIERIEDGVLTITQEVVFHSIHIGEVDQNSTATFGARFSGSLVIGSLKGHVDFQDFAPIAGSITIDLLDGGRIDVGKTLPAGSIKITDMAPGSHAVFRNMRGEIILGNGVPAGAQVAVLEIGPNFQGLVAPGRIELFDKDVDGNLFVFGGDGAIENGGMVNGPVILGVPTGLAVGGIFSGTADFAGVGPAGVISAMPGGTLSGVVDISGDWAGTLGGVLAGVYLHIGGDMSGSISVMGQNIGTIAVDGHISGDVTFEAEVLGELLANADGIGGGDITGAVSMPGSFHGNICGDNLSPIESLPANIDISVFEDDATICGARPGCGNGTIVAASPADGTHDARQPHPVNDNGFSARQGIGSPNSYTGGPEPIIVTLSQGGANHVDCWSLCETGFEQVEGGASLLDNFVASVAETPSGDYEIVLNRPISAGHWTTITFFGDDSEVSYASLPADVNADGLSASGDLTSIINYINGVQTPPYGTYSSDVDHSGATGVGDIYAVLDLLNGAGTFIEWNTQTRPATNTCASGSGGPGKLPPAAPGPIPTEASTEMSDSFLTFVTNTHSSGEEAENDFRQTGQAIAVYCRAHFNDTARHLLADRLADPTLTCACHIGAQVAEAAVATLRP